MKKDRRTALQIPPVGLHLQEGHISRPRNRAVPGRQRRKVLLIQLFMEVMPEYASCKTEPIVISPFRVSVTVQDEGLTAPRPLLEKSVQSAGYTQINGFSSFQA